jgi:hypothetical protein
MTGETVRTNPEVPERLLNDLRIAIQAFHDGKLKGRLSPTISDAIELYLVSMYAREPGRLKHLEKYIDPDDVDELDDPDAYRERILHHANRVSGTTQEVAHQLHREGPGQPTRFEEFLMLQDSEGTAVNSQRDDQDQPNQLENSLIQSSQSGMKSSVDTSPDASE